MCDLSLSPIPIAQPTRYFAPPYSAPPSPPPPPSPASPASIARPHVHAPRPTPLLRRSATTAGVKTTIFDLTSSSPLSPSAADKTLLLSRLDRARRTQVLLQEGQPARALTEVELKRLRREEAGESSTASASAAGGEGGGTGPDDEPDLAVSPPPVDGQADAHASVAQASIPAPNEETPGVVAAMAIPAPASHAHSAPLAFPSAHSPGRTAHATPARSPTRASLGVASLLSRPPMFTTHLDRSPVSAVPPILSRSSRSYSTPAPDSHALSAKLAEAAAAQKARSSSRKAPSPARSGLSAMLHDPPQSTTRNRRNLGKTSSLPFVSVPSAPPTPRAHARAATAPGLVLSTSGPTFTSAASASRSTHPSPTTCTRRTPSPTTSPALLPVMGASDPSSLTLHFARLGGAFRPGELVRTGSASGSAAGLGVGGEGWHRALLLRQRAAGVSSWGSAGTQRASRGGSEAASDSESSDDAEHGEEDEGVYTAFDSDVLASPAEPSVFASPRSTFAYSASLSRSRSISSTATHSPSLSLSTSPTTSMQLFAVGGGTGPAVRPETLAQLEADALATQAALAAFPPAPAAAGQRTAFMPAGRAAKNAARNSARASGQRRAASDPSNETTTPLPAAIAPTKATSHQPSRASSRRPALSAAAGPAAGTGGLDLKQLRAEQLSRRLGYEAQGGAAGEGWSTSSSEEAVEEETVEVRGRRRGGAKMGGAKAAGGRGGGKGRS
ncbi:uncharacterized protein JCM10292_004746 [Rhodotorula paludigena]|uniref:uncharacterized protein n=1 Tax=Rhodotorula paludigena TaxID=86838 RepID=UPI00317E59A7